MFIKLKTHELSTAPVKKNVPNAGCSFDTITNEIKIVIVGNVGSGKTTAISAISEIPFLGTEATARNRDTHRKTTTTVAMEYGSLQLQRTKIHLYGTPGQRRFDFMASIILKGAAGMIVMIDNACDYPLKELDYFLQFHEDYLKSNPAIVAITHLDDIYTSTNTIDYHVYIRQHGFNIPVIRLDARVESEVKSILMKLLIEILKTRQSTIVELKINQILSIF